MAPLLEIITVVLLLVTAVSSEVRTASHCYHDGVIPLRCSGGAILRVYNVTYGLSESNSCSYAEGDCTLTEQTSYGCNGKSSCDISIRGQTKYYNAIPRCGLMGNYLRVIYECIEQEDIVNICAVTRPETIRSKGYISSPYFNLGSYSGLLNCQYKIYGSNIKLHLITMNLTDTNDCLEIHNTLRTQTYCGGGSLLENYDIISYIPTNEITISFTSGLRGHNGGVWIYYEMTPLIPNTVVRQTVPPSTAEAPTVTGRKLPSTQSPLTTLLVRSWTEKMKDGDDKDDDADITIYNNVSSHIPVSTLATILGLIFGLFGATIMILFTIYFFKRYRDHKKKRARRRSGTSGGDHVMWHNITNECLSEIIDKHEATCEQGYSNNMMSKEGNSVPDPPYQKHVEHSFC